MDHLPVPIDGHHVGVSFFAIRRVYQPGEFFSFPKEYMEAHDLASLDDMIHEGFANAKDDWFPGRLNQLLQSWLFFALLAQVLGVPVDSKDFDNEHQNQLTTSSLSAVLHKWADRWKKSAEQSDPAGISNQKNTYVQASMALDFARRFCWKHLAYRPHEEDDYGREVSPRQLQHPHDRLDAAMILSIASIGEILQDELWARLPPRQKDRVQFWKQPEDEERNWGYSHWCRTRMQQDGWSPSEIRRIEGTMPHVNVIYYACSISRGSNEHQKASCRKPQCELCHGGEMESLAALHVTSCTSQHCGQPVPVGEPELERIIDQGMVPLVQWTNGGRLICKGHNLDGDSTIPYGAISHSWADKILSCGKDFGGQNDRTMLRCQLQRLRKDFTAIFDKIDEDEQDKLKNRKTDLAKFQPWRVKQKDEEPWFWVDVLCVPRSWDHKAKLLNRLHSIYKKATAVLIWDRDLMEHTVPSGDNCIEMTVRLNTGQWSRRLWTLPEAVLAKNLFVAFKNGNLSLEDMEKACDSAKANLRDDNHFVWKAGIPFTSTISEIRSQLHNQEPGDPTESALEPGLPVQRAWKAVQFREATHHNDQTIVLASVLGLDVSGFLTSGSSASQRMIGFLNALDEAPRLGIPSGLIFLPDPKLSEKSYGWAPETWMSKQLYTYPLFRPSNKMGYMMPHGLHVEFPGLILHCPTPVLDGKDFWMPVSQTLHKWYKIELDAAGTHMDRLKDGLSPSDEHCIILNASKTRERWEAGLFVRRNGLLACGAVWRVQIVCRVWVRLETRASKLQKLRTEFYENAEEQYFAERVDSQRWCIEESLGKYAKFPGSSQQ